MGLWKKIRRAVKKAGQIFTGTGGGGGSGPINPGEPVPRREPVPVPGRSHDETKAEIERGASELLRKFTEGVPGAVAAVGHFIENSAHSAGSSLSKAERRLREGKVVDAFWHFYTDRLSETEKNTLKAAQESELLRSLMQAAASSYGPAGAAAFAAWYTYRTTNNVELALKAGIIEGAKAAALSGIDKEIPKGTPDQIAAKAVVSGAVGGVAIAAAGGNAEEVKKGFLATGASVAVLDGYELKTGRTLGQDLKDLSDSATESVGGFIVKSTAVTSKPAPAHKMNELKPPPKGGLKVNNGDWCINWDMKNLGSEKSAVVLTYVGKVQLYDRNSPNP